MSPEKQRIAIAEACGWRVNKVMDEPITYRIEPMIGTQHYYNTVEEVASAFPDYLTDLNACHEMEKVLTESQRMSYILELIRVCQRTTPELQVCFATAAQRCEAFLRTIGKWEDA